MDHSPRWPLWLPVAAIGCGAAFGLVVVAVIAGIAQTPRSHGITVAGTVVLDVSVVVASVLLAGLIAPPRPWQFGLRGAPLKFTAQIASLGALAYLLFSVVYAAVVRPENPQRVVEDLGADQSKLLLVVGALVVLAVAPVCEEVFFRGFVFKVLRQRIPLWPAAAVDGLFFGLVHGSLVLVPLLGVLGIVFCYVYERTGSIFPTIALHSLNNTISYGVKTDWGVALTVGGLVIAACAYALARAPRRDPAGITGVGPAT
jgi:membrane protease YdiL (CAAX protease family)